MNRVQDLLDFSGLRRTPVILQTEAAECGLAALAMVACFHGFNTDLATLRRRYSISIKGTTLAHLIALAGDLKLASRALRLELAEIRQLRMPAVVHWELSHFVVLTGVNRRGIVIHDPARGRREIEWEQVSRKFTGIALELLPAEGFEQKDERRAIRVWNLLGRVSGLKRALGQIFALAFCLEVFALVAPLFMQLVVDQAIAAADRNLLTVLAVGFAMLMLVQLAIAAFRSWLLVYLGTSLNLQVASNLLAHLLRLPMAYFEQRHLGDITSRFASMSTIQGFISSSFIEALMDGLMAIATLAMMLVYAPKLVLVVVAAGVLYLLLRIATYLPLRAASEEQIVHGAKQQSHFMESLRGMQSIKLFGKRELRLGAWQNMAVNNYNRGIAVQKMGIGFIAANGLLFGAENILVVWLGANAVLDGGFSVGMLFAFMSYKGNFEGRLSSLINKCVDYRMLSLHAARVADIALHEPDEEGHAAAATAEEIVPRLEIRDLHFRYSEADQPVLQGVWLTVEPGESVAIIGPSGCGKTTLLKILVGLLRHQQGAFLLGGIEVQRLGLGGYRSMIGAVMQEDQLFAGSITDNIGFFEDGIDQQWVEQCAAVAAVHQEIVAMPMGYSTLIGDMGTSLSGGQKQRILLARALYKRPKLLFLDEATSHLDVLREKSVNAAIKALKLTTVIVAHRPETIAMADRVVILGSPDLSGLPQEVLARLPIGADASIARMPLPSVTSASL
jgi:ATP-binding cassette, subfamily B, bacterial CvaB/MchF/RaxB